MRSEVRDGVHGGFIVTGTASIQCQLEMPMTEDPIPQSIRPCANPSLSRPALHLILLTLSTHACLKCQSPSAHLDLYSPKLPALTVSPHYQPSPHIAAIEFLPPSIPLNSFINPIAVKTSDNAEVLSLTDTLHQLLPLQKFRRSSTHLLEHVEFRRHWHFISEHYIASKTRISGTSQNALSLHVLHLSVDAFFICMHLYLILG